MTDTKRGSLLPSEKELKYFRKQFVQSASLQGRIGKFYQIKDFKYMGTDQDYTYEKAVDVAYHLNENPSRKFLTKYGWYVEDAQSVPIILILTYYDINNNPIKIDEGAIIELSGKKSIDPNDLITEQFIITTVHTDLEMNQAVCQIVPKREKQIENVKVLADKKDPTLENVYLNRGIYYDEGVDSNESNEFIKRS